MVLDEGAGVFEGVQNVTYQPLRRYIGSLIGNMKQEQGKYMLKPGFEEISRFFEHFRPIWAPGERL